MPKVIVTHEDDSWKVKIPENKRASFVCKTKSEAKVKATELAKQNKAELTIMKVDGTIGEKNSFGNDPRKIKG